jgi:hypothetical protein
VITPPTRGNAAPAGRKRAARRLRNGAGLYPKTPPTLSLYKPPDSGGFGFPQPRPRGFYLEGKKRGGTKALCLLSGSRGLGRGTRERHKARRSSAGTLLNISPLVSPLI